MAIMILLCGKYWYDFMKVFSIKAEEILVPIGVSFYTLQAIGYVYKIYKDCEVPEYNFIDYALWLAFFPKIISGPIETRENFLQQIKEKHITYDQIERGFYLIVYGYFLKLVIADRLYILTSYIQNSYLQRSGFSLLAAAIFYSFQIYCDFAGYSIIAQGVASTMGFNLITNFKSPYLAENIGEFWRRWHISLSSWLKEYIYFPLGGNRVNRRRTYINLIITFVVSGIWHGFGLNYIFWGVLHAIYQIIERFKKNILVKNIGRIWTFGMVTIAWIFFSMPSLEKQ